MTNTMPAGRPTKQTPAIAAIIVDALTQGAGRSVAISLAGISRDSFDRWKVSDPEFRARITAAERTPARRAGILDAVRAGSPRKAAVGYMGLDEAALNDWLKADARFSAEFTQAEWGAEVSRVAGIAQAMNGGFVVSRNTTVKPDGTRTVSETMARPEWTAAAWWLERRRGDEWGRRDKVDMEIYVRERARELGLNEDDAVREIKPRLRVVS